MRIFTREYVKGDSLSFIELDDLVIDDRADSYSEELYAEVYADVSKDKELKTIFNGNYLEPLLEALLFMPREILIGIPDIRVFMLGVVSQNTYEKMVRFINEWSKENEQLIKEEKIRERADRKKVSMSCKALYDLTLNDAIISDISYEGNDLILSAYTMEDENVIIALRNGKLIEMEKNIVGDRIYTYELYVNENNIEFNILCQNSEAVITFKDAKVERTTPSDLL